MVQVYMYVYILVNATALGASGSGRTQYWCNRSVVTRRNLAVSDIYASIFGKNAPYSSYILLCRYSQSLATHR